jgi:hypothetical protein
VLLLEAGPDYAATHDVPEDLLDADGACSLTYPTRPTGRASPVRGKKRVASPRKRPSGLPHGVWATGRGDSGDAGGQCGPSVVLGPRAATGSLAATVTNDSWPGADTLQVDLIRATARHSGTLRHFRRPW